MKLLSIILLSLLIMTYPLMIYFGLDYFEIRYIGLLLAAVLTARYLLLKNNIPAEKKKLLLSSTFAGILLGLAVFVFNQPLIAKFYPVLMSLVALAIFSFSLWQPPSIIEMFARIQHPDLPESGVHYTRKVTIVWCCFFVINGAIATYTALIDNIELWTLYNGLISYILMGILFALEFLVRMRVAKHK